jgi:hypothetical protein
MVLCEKEKCKHLVAVKDNFDGQEIIIGYKCEEGFAIETNEDIGYARMAPECEKYEKSAE